MQTLKTKFARLSAKFAASFLYFVLIFSFMSTAPAMAAASPCDKKVPTTTSLNNCLNQNPIIKDVKTVVNFLSAGVGIVVVGSIIWAGIQYVMAGNNPNAVGAAKKRLQDTLIALLAFFFIYAFINWLIPGGLLSGIV
jgi:hypothetical protein